MFCNVISCVGCTCGEVVWLTRGSGTALCMCPGTEGFTSSVEE